jgi:DNA-binding response OmpR family regulator
MSGSATTDAIVGRVMIVDDDPIVSGMLGVTLEAAGHSVAEMESGDAALASLAARPADALPEVLFVDIEMPGMNGYALCRQLKADRRYAHIPVVFISSHDTLDDRITAYEAGGDDFVAKPFDAQEAAQKAAICIRHHRKEVQARSCASPPRASP